MYFLFNAVNYCVSGCACQWYIGKDYSCCQPLKWALLKNFGSIVGGSFINGFLYLPSLVVNLFCSELDICCCNCLDLPRFDVYSYIYLTGNSYCPSVRQCQYLCKRSEIARTNESTLRIYSLAARIFICLVTMLCCYWMGSDYLVGEKLPMYMLLGALCIGLYMSSYFVDIHVDVAEALQTCFLAEWDMERP